METAAIMRMKELVQKLDRAAKAYYQQDIEIISNREYDQMYDELQALEKETGTVLANSPTVSVGYEAVDQKKNTNPPCCLWTRLRTEKF